MSRASLASVFLLAVWLDPPGTAYAADLGYIMVILYAAWSALLVFVAMRSWWHEYRFAPLVQGIDILAFAAAAFLTEAADGNFHSPFLAFAAFLLITASLRWGMRTVGLTAITLTMLYGAVGTGASILGLAHSVHQLLHRETYLIALSIMLVWLGAGPKTPRMLPLPDPGGIPGKRKMELISSALTFTCDTLHAQKAAIALLHEEELWTEVFHREHGQIRVERLPFDDQAGHADDPDTAVLFDTRKGRRITSTPDDRLGILREHYFIELSNTFAANEGISANFSFNGAQGELLIWTMDAPCVDDLPVARSLAREIGAALEHEETAALAQSIAVANVRNAVARDLHDSVAQFMAGTIFRLEALRGWCRRGEDPDEEIVAIKSALRTEQRHLRAMIDRLRNATDGDRDADVIAELQSVLDEIGQHWQISTDLISAHVALDVPIGLAYDLRQLVREAVANAVRHGECRHIELVLKREPDQTLRIRIRDDGKGFPEAPTAPRSIDERIRALGGRLNVANTNPGVELHIEVPIRKAS
ncbi:putative signal transduction histidine kinase [Novosphingobium nitrogenifigens DSM 19370]|uniref:Putative signal transduction histidine kinase n=1 Tax=Novosphingobium nitrogenifigens DSM 19370 TaxID=983920 RepID=F1ZBE3_9SPHN|nr:putative signal transduction histidine kinase [Novosphingobium nitrogenifigens DSM 19370]